MKQYVTKVILLYAFRMIMFLALLFILVNLADAKTIKPKQPDYVDKDTLSDEIYLDGYTEPIHNTQVHFCGQDGPENAKFPDFGICHDGKIFVIFKESINGKIKYRERELEIKIYWREDTGLQCDFTPLPERCAVQEIKHNKIH